MFKRSFLLPLVILCSTALFAAAPSWVVNPASFQYSMSVTAVANINCTELTNPSVKLGAFVGGVLRGTALTSNVNNGRYVASMIVYSNVTSAETVAFKFYNPANDSVYDARVTAAFQENASYGTSVTPFVVLNNNAPTALGLSNNSISEGLPANATVGALSSTDVDVSETFTYTLVSGTGSADNANFSVSGNNLVTAMVMNYAVKSQHNIRVRTTDANGCYFEQAFTIHINDVNTPPTNILITDSTVNENSTALTAIGTLSALDFDAGETFTYTLVSGTGSTHNASFNINGNLLRTSAPFNYEVKSSYSIRIRVTDVIGNQFERAFTVLINDMNDVPSAIQLNGSATGASFAENKPLGSIAATISTTDEDAANSFIYTFINTAGNNNSDFAIVGNQLRTNNVFDYETRQSYVVFIQSNDGNGGLLTRQFLLSVTDSNDAPTAMSLTNASLNENLASNTFIGRLNTTDPDLSSTFTYTLANGAGSGGNGSFRISNDSLYSNAAFDFENVSSYSIRVNVNDGNGGNYQQNFQVAILNANDAPTDINITSNQVAENQPANTVVGTLSTNDQDVTNTFVYTLISGTGSTDNSSFNISGSNLRTSASFDYETKNLYSLRIKTTDNNGSWFEKIITVSITNVSDVPTNITLSNDTISENVSLNTLIGTLASVNQDSNITYTYSFDNNIAGNNNSSFAITGNQLRSNAVFDYETKNAYLIYVTSNDGSGGTFTKQLPVAIRNMNDAPVDLLLSNASVNENVAAHTYIGRLTSVDPDNNPAFTYTLVSGAGSNDNSSFTVSNDSLFANSVFDFETRAVYNIRVQTSDNLGGTYQEIVTININNTNDEPTNIALSEQTVNENLPANTTVGSFSTTDQDSGNTFIYSLVSGTGSTDNGSFVISGNALRISSSFDYETKSSYSIRIKTTDNAGGGFEKTFTITVNNTNDAPTNITLSNDTITENRAINSLVGTLGTTDQDVSNTFTYSFSSVAGNSNALFTLTGNQLRTNAVFNFEQASTYFIYVQTNDGNGATYTKQFQVNIKDSNDAPTDIALSISGINENKPAGTFIGQFSSTDPDQGNTFAYALVNGTGSTNNNSFVVSNDSLYTASVLNFELQNTFTIRVRTTDNNGLSYPKAFTITVNDSNDLPTGITLSTSSVSENLASGTSIGTLNTIDADAGQSFSYALVAGAGSADNNSFSIQNGVLKTNKVFNYELKDKYTVRIQTNDGNGGTFTDTFNIAILDANDAPTNIALSNNAISENRQAGSLIGTFSTTDEDANTFNYSFVAVGNNDNNSFLINGNELKTNASFNFESKQLYVINVQTSDGNGGSFTKQFLVNITDSNDAPTDISLSNNLVEENLAAHTFIGKLTTTDIDAAGGLNTYALVTGQGSTHNSSFAISNDSLFTNASFNYEAQQAYSIRLKTIDNGGLWFEKAFTVNIKDANDAPTALALSNNRISENSTLRTLIGKFSTTDADAISNFTYTFVAGAGATDNGSFVIAGNELRSNALFNFEAMHTYSIRVQSADNNGGTTEQDFTIEIGDSNDAPTNLALSNGNFMENRPVSSVIGTFTTTDQDTADVFIYSFANVPGNDNGSFYINANQLRSNATFDFESKRTYAVYVQTTDGLATFTKQFTINITDSNDAPVNVSLYSQVVDENQPAGTFVTTIYSSDADASGAFVYTLANGTGSVNNASFRISNDSLYTNAAFNYETKSSYSIRIRTTDNGGLWMERQFEIDINNTNDSPTDISLSTTEITENKLSRTLVALLATTDADANNFTYSLVSGAGATDNSSFIIAGNLLRSNKVFNYEAQASYSIRIQTNDGNGGTFEKAFTITVTDSNDAPSDIVLSTSQVVENAAIGTKVCTISTIDQDVADGFNYSFVNVTGNNNSSFIIVGDELRTNAIFDYESKNFYLVLLQTTDAAGASYTRQFVINIKDTNDLPVALELANSNVDENQPSGTFVGLLSATDPDQAENFAYTLVGGAGAADNNSFRISADSLLTNTTFNYEAKKVFQVRIRVSDSGSGKFEKAFTIAITDVNDAPTALAINNLELRENAPLNTPVGSFTTTDADAGDVHTYTLVAGTGSTDNARFTITGNQLLSNLVADYEIKSSYIIRVRSEDAAGESVERSYTVSIIDVSEKPAIVDQQFSVSENAATGLVIGTVVSASPDAGALLRYSFEATGTDNPFSLDENTGAVTVAAKLDYEKAGTYIFKVIVKDDQPLPLYDTAMLTIKVSDEIETRQSLPANNYMSPNGDGSNDLFVIENVALYVDYSLVIYNESGLEVYKTAGNYQNTWDGTYSGNALPTGVYFYVFHNSKTGDEFKGALNIIK